MRPETAVRWITILGVGVVVVVLAGLIGMAVTRDVIKDYSEPTLVGTAPDGTRLWVVQRSGSSVFFTSCGVVR